MKQLQEFLTPLPADTCFNGLLAEVTFKVGPQSFQAKVSWDLIMTIQGCGPQQMFAFKLSCLMFPYFSNKKITSVAVFSGNNALSISGAETDIDKLYQKLKRLLSHKGFTEFYKPIKRLGRGTFATVYLVQHKSSGIRRAAKVFSKEGQKIEYKGKEALENEIKTLREIDHPNLIKYDGLYETEALVYLVTEYLSGGTLDDTLKNKANLSGRLIQGVIRDILEGLAYLDDNHIMHRDIKPENVILREEENRWVISDFGLAARSDSDYLYDKCGTMGYIAPEIMALQENQKYAQACDTYSLGVIAYQLIVGELPFKVESVNLFDKKIIWVLFDRDECKDIHPLILEFMRKLLDQNPDTRITPKQALRAPFFTDSHVVGELIAFHERKKQARYDRILKMANIN